MSEDNKKPFTISDRRHFTPEGEVRQPAAGGSAATPSEPAPAPPEPAEGDAVPASPPGTDATAAEDPSGLRFPNDFLGLLISLGAQASVLLTGGPEGDPADLEAAHSLIELLGSLKDKTEGRRSPEEDRLLEGLLYELRMAYVKATRAGGR